MDTTVSQCNCPTIQKKYLKMVLHISKCFFIKNGHSINKYLSIISPTCGTDVIDRPKGALSNAITMFSNHPYVAKIIRSVTSTSY